MSHEPTPQRERVTPPAHERVTLLDLVDRVLDKGVVISGDITLSVADVDLVYLNLRALLSSVASLEEDVAATRTRGESARAGPPPASTKPDTTRASPLRDH